MYVLAMYHGVHVALKKEKLPSGQCSLALHFRVIIFIQIVSIRHTYINVSGLVNKPTYVSNAWLVLILSQEKIGKSQSRMIEISLVI